MSGGRRDLAIAGILPSIAAAAAAVLYDDPLLMLMVIVAAAATGAVPVGLVRGRRSLAGPIAVAALAVLLLVIVLITDGGAGLGTALRGLGGSLAHLLSFAPPIATRADTLTPPVIVVWAASYLAATAATRGKRLLSAAPTATVLISALLFVGAAAPVPAWVAPGVALGTVVLLLAPAARREHRSGWFGRRPGGTVTAVVVAVSLVTIGVLAAYAVPGTRRLDARTRYQPPKEQVRPIDPLTRLAGWAKGDRQPLVALTSDATAPGDPAPKAAWRWAVLDRFDGARWTSSAQYRPTGGLLRSSSDVEDTTTSASSRLVRAAVEVSPTLAPWLPTPGTVLRVRGPEVRVNADQDSLESASPGPSYSLVAGTTLNAEDPGDRARIAGLAAGNPGDPAATLAVPRLPEQLREVAIAFEPTTATTDGERALRLQDMLRDNGQFTSDAAAGHLYLRLAQFFDENSPNYLRGTSEQFATAFAVLARAVRLPTRVVVGFESPVGGSTRTTITGADMQAWPEVYFAGQGWVRFDPTPPDRGAGAVHRPRKLAQVLPRNQRPAHSGAVEQAVVPSGNGDQARRAKHTGVSTALTVAGIVLASLAGLVVLGLLTVLMLRLRLTARRRRVGEPAHRVIGAWQELEDAVHLTGGGTAINTAINGVSAASGVSARAGATALAETIDERLQSATQTTVLAQLANAAAFGPPNKVSTADAEQAWSISDRTTAGLRRAATRGRRWTWWLRPGPVLHRSRR